MAGMGLRVDGCDLTPSWGLICLWGLSSGAVQQGCPSGKLSQGAQLGASSSPSLPKCKCTSCVHCSLWPQQRGERLFLPSCGGKHVAASVFPGDAALQRLRDVSPLPGAAAAHGWVEAAVSAAIVGRRAVLSNGFQLGSAPQPPPNLCSSEHPPLHSAPGTHPGQQHFSHSLTYKHPVVPFGEHCLSFAKCFGFAAWPACTVHCTPSQAQTQPLV